MIKNTINLCILGLSFFVLTQCTSAPEISQWRGPNRDGIYPEKNLLKEWPAEGPELLWKYENLGKGYASAAVLFDKVLTIATLDSISYIMAFDHEGGILYKKELGPEWMTNFPGSRSTPLLYDKLGYYLGALGVLYCFEIETGEVKWTKDLFTEFDGKNNRYGITENLLIEGDQLFCMPGGKKDNVIALNKNTGELIWRCDGNGGASVYASPILIEMANEKYLITISDSTVLSVNIKDGSLAWKYNMYTGNPLPIYKEGYLFLMDYITEKDRGAIMLKIADDGKSVAKEWFSNSLNVVAMFGGELIIDNKIYGSNSKQKGVFCIDWKTGVAIDSIKNNSLISTLIAADDMIYSYGFEGNISLLKHDENGFNIVSTFRVEGGLKNQHCSHPVIHNSRLYIRHDNSLFVYDISAKK